MGKITAAITGVGQYLPDYILTNDELSRMVDTNDEWIMSHTGIKTRHILKGEGIGTSYMGARAVMNLLDKTGVDPMSIDVVICATVTPDMFFPSTGNLIADQAGCKNAFAYDVSAACEVLATICSRRAANLAHSPSLCPRAAACASMAENSRSETIRKRSSISGLHSPSGCTRW